MDTLMHLPGFFSHQISLNGLFQQLASGSFLHSQLNFGGGATSSGSSMALWDGSNVFHRRPIQNPLLLP